MPRHGGRRESSKPRCVGHSSQTGKPCPNFPIHGAVVCRMHGGATEQVKAAALRRLAMLACPAVDTLGRRMRADRKAPGPAVAAARDVLDRTLGKPIETVEHRGETQMHYTVTYLPLVRPCGLCGVPISALPGGPDSDYNPLLCGGCQTRTFRRMSQNRTVEALPAAPDYVNLAPGKADGSSS